MGLLSWTRAENTTKRANIINGDKYKLLVPSKFGGGYISDIYHDDGYILRWGLDKSCKYVDSSGMIYDGALFVPADLYGILAYWNSCDNMRFDSTQYPEDMLTILKHGLTTMDQNRYNGIKLGIRDEFVDKLLFPLKLVSVSYRGTYESCKGRSYCDPNQGLDKGYWSQKEYQKYFDKLQEQTT